MQVVRLRTVPHMVTAHSSMQGSKQVTAVQQLVDETNSPYSSYASHTSMLLFI